MSLSSRTTSVMFDSARATAAQRITEPNFGQWAIAYLDTLGDIDLRRVAVEAIISVIEGEYAL